MKKIYLLVFLLTVFCMFANVPPVVSNVNVTQRDDGSYMVDIYYDIQDDDGDCLLVSIAASENDGSSWDYLISTVSGDTGNDIISGNNKHIIWDFAIDHPQVLDVPVIIKVTADDRNGAGFESCTVASGDYTYGENDAIQTISYDYEIMKYEVTNAQYIAYLQAALASGEVYINDGDVYGYYEGDDYSAAGNYALYDLGTPFDYIYGRISHNGDSFILNAPDGYNADDFLEHPVVFVTWTGAKIFAKRYGWRLPTEQEWEKAARGNTGYNYPWGETLSGDKANYFNSGHPSYNGTTPVGYFNGNNGTTDSPSPYGCYDMCGNVFNLTYTYESSINVAIIRGGSFSIPSNEVYLYSWYTNYFYSDETCCSVGFRCVRTLP